MKIFIFFKKYLHFAKCGSILYQYLCAVYRFAVNGD